MVRKQITGEEIKRIIGEENVQFLRLIFTNILGAIKNIEVPVNQIDKVLENKMMFDGSSIEGFVRIEESDMYLYPDLSAWVTFPQGNAHGKVAHLVCDVYNPDGAPFAGDPRGNLRQALKDMRDLGFTSFDLEPEPEFFSSKLDENGGITTTLGDKGGYFNFAPTDLDENYRRDIVLESESLGFEVEASYHKVAPGQYEADFKYADVADTCDNIQTFKPAVKTAARRHGLHATFVPKPLFGINGSGTHCNISLFDDEGNVFYDKDGELELSEAAYHFLGGLLKHARAYIAVYNPAVNFYKRLVPGYGAPVCVAWGDHDRSPLVRIPESRSLSTYLELRSVDPPANLYLAMAVLLQAGLDGIHNQITPPAAVDHNIYVMDEGEREAARIRDLPSTIHNAIKELRKDNVIIDALGQHVFSGFVEAKRLEWAAFRQTVSEWERGQYLKLY